MYKKHVYVHTARYGWSTLPFEVDTPFVKTAAKCDIELVLLHCWSFGEVLKIRWPIIPTVPQKPRSIDDKSTLSTKVSITDDNSKDVILWKMVKTLVIPRNVGGAKLPIELPH